MAPLRHPRADNERRALKVVGICFLCLAGYIAYEAAIDLWSKRAMRRSSIVAVFLAVLLLGGPIMACVVPDAQTGKILWNFASGGSVIDGPSIVDSVLYWGIRVPKYPARNRK
jgi:hypothetical protein